jgi:hypothetical protein
MLHEVSHTHTHIMMMKTNMILTIDVLTSSFNMVMVWDCEEYDGMCFIMSDASDWTDFYVNKVRLLTEWEWVW